MSDKYYTLEIEMKYERETIGIYSSIEQAKLAARHVFGATLDWEYEIIWEAPVDHLGFENGVDQPIRRICIFGYKVDAKPHSSDVKWNVNQTAGQGDG